jgi:hypothetical protein
MGNISRLYGYDSTVWQHLDLKPEKNYKVSRLIFIGCTFAFIIPLELIGLEVEHTRHMQKGWYTVESTT